MNICRVFGKKELKKLRAYNTLWCDVFVHISQVYLNSGLTNLEHKKLEIRKQRATRNITAIIFSFHP